MSVTTPDYAAVLADLTRRRAELDAAIAAITPLCSGATPAANDAFAFRRSAPVKKAKVKAMPKKKAAATRRPLDAEPAEVNHAAIDRVVADDQAKRRGPWRECPHCHKWRRGEQGPCVHCGKPKAA